MNAKKAREEAERLHLQRLDQMRLEKEAKDKMEKEQMIAKRSGQKKNSNDFCRYFGWFVIVKCKLFSKIPLFIPCNRLPCVGFYFFSLFPSRAHIEDAEKRRNQDVDDSKMVDEVFGFLPGDSDGGGAGGVTKKHLSCNLDGI